MPSVGTAYVNIRINSSSFSAQLKAMLNKLDKDFEKAGADLGKSFQRGMNSAGFDKSFDPLTKASADARKSVGSDLDSITAKARNANRDISNAMSGAGSGFDELIRGSGEARKELDNFEGAAERADRATRNIGGGGGGGSFRSIASGASDASNWFDQLAAKGDAASATLSKLYNLNAFGGTAMAGLIGGLSAAAQGVFALGANAAQAVPAMAAFVNAGLGMAQVGGVMAIAMHGVGDAITKGLKPVPAAAASTSRAVGGIGRATASAGRAVRDAKQGLQRAYQDAARSAEDAARRTLRAEQALATAQRESLSAQRALNAARKEGLEQLEDIAFAAEDASLAERQAALDLQDATAKLQATSELPPDNRARQEAQLAFDEAELRMRQAKDAREDADRDQQEAAKNGVEGTKAMRDARKDVADAQQRQADAARDLADARRDEARTAQDNARRIADAQKTIADAQARFIDAQKQGTPQTRAAAKAVDAYAQAMAKLSPEQQKFVRNILDLKGRFGDLRATISDPLFRGLNTSLGILFGPQGRADLDAYADSLAGTSSVLGDFTVKASELATNDIFRGNLTAAMDSNNTALADFSDAALNLVDALASIAAVAGPTLVEPFAKWVEQLTKGWSESLRTEEGIGKLQDRLDRARTTIRQVWNLFKELWNTIKIVGGAAATASEQFAWTGDEGKARKGFIPMMTQNLKDFNENLDKTDLVDRFTTALSNMSSAAGAVKTVLQPFIDIGSDPQIGQAFDTIAKSDAFERLGANAGNAAPELAELATNVLDIFAALSESDSLDQFLSTLTFISGVVADIVKNPIVGWFLGFTGVIYGTRRALKLTQSVGETLFAPMAKSIKTAQDKFTAFRDQVKKGGFKSAVKMSLTGKLGGAAGGAEEATADAKIIAAIAEQTTAIVAAIETCCATMRGLGGALGKGGGAAGAAGAGGLLASGAGAGGSSALGTAAADAGKLGRFAKVIGPVSKMLKPLALGFRIVGGALRFMMGPWGMLIFTLLPILWPLLVKLNDKFHIVEKVMGAITVALEATGEAFKWLWGKIKDLFNWVKSNWPTILAIITGPIGIAVLLITKNWDTIKAVVSSAIDYIKGLFTGMWDGIMAGWTAVATFLSSLWSDHVWPVIQSLLASVSGKLMDFFKAIITGWTVIGQWLGDVWKVHVKPKITLLVQNVHSGLSGFWNGIKAAFAAVGTWIDNLWTNKVRPKIRALITSVTGGLSKFWDGIKSAFTSIGTWLDNLYTKHIKSRIATLVSNVTSGVSGMWDGIKTGFAKAVNWVGGKMQKYLFDPINTVLDKFGAGTIKFKWSDLPVPGQATGGPVRGPGTGTSDSVLRRLSNGEHVWTAREVAAAGGHHNVEAMRKATLDGGTGGLWGYIADKAGDLKGALGKGAAFAIKWAIGKFTNQLPDNLIGKIINGLLTKAADKFTGWGKKKDQAAAAAAASDGGEPYNGPPGGWTYPLARRVVITQYPNSGHNPSWSVDLGAPMGTGVRAVSAGRVSIARSLGNTSYGNYIVITHAGGQQSLYAHLRSMGVKVGQVVKTGQTIGYSDSTGHSTGPHLHFELKPSSSTIAAMAAHGVKLGSGGVVGASPAGTLALLAEAGKSERVTPLDTEGFTPAERRIIETLEAKLGAGGDHYHVHPSEKMDETRLADLVARRVKWSRRRGTGR